MLRSAGAEKITFAGGEPTLHKHIGELLVFAKSLGFVTCVVTNGFRLNPLLDKHAGSLDWVGLSIDSMSEEIQLRLGRGHGDYVKRALELSERCHALGVRVKLNTVVTRLNLHESLHDLVRAVVPERWKVFQVLRVEGQNDGQVEELLISNEEFLRYVDRHAELIEEGFAPVVEDNETMMESYAMIDPLGRFYGDSGGIHRESEPILEVGVDRALRQVGFRADKFISRGGHYEW